jgi:NADPH:quinone reductase-like Zn-dependent oxidoreductase
MRAMHEVVLPRYGPPEVFEERAVAERPLAPHEARVRVRASGVNFADIMQRLGLYASAAKPPYVPGFEVAGEVVEVGREVQHLQVGNRVVTMMTSGGYSQQVVAPAERILQLPAGIDFDTAAALPVNYLTAWFCMFDMGALRAGQTILIHHGAGGVGVGAIQLARRTGARVLATTGTAAKIEFLRELGADGAFCIADPDWAHQVEALVGHRGVDVVLDPVGGRVMKQGLRLIAPLGRLIAFGLSQAVAGPGRNPIAAAIAYLRSPRVNPLQLTTDNIGVFGFHLAHLHGKEERVLEALTQIVELTAAGELAPRVDSTHPLTAAGVASAHRRIHERANRGKVLLVDPG